MVEIGSVVRGKITRVEVYGLWVDVNGESMLIMIPDTSWTDSRPLRERFQTGQEIEAVAMRYNYKDRQIVGSIRLLHPESNPYRHLSRLEPGTEIQGRIVRIWDNEATVDLPNSIWGKMHLPNNTEQLKAGDRVVVTVASIEIENGRLCLDFIRKLADATNGTAVASPALEFAHGANP